MSTHDYFQPSEYDTYNYYQILRSLPEDIQSKIKNEGEEKNKTNPEKLSLDPDSCLGSHDTFSEFQDKSESRVS